MRSKFARNPSPDEALKELDELANLISHYAHLKIPAKVDHYLRLVRERTFYLAQVARGANPSGLKPDAEAERETGHA